MVCCKLLLFYFLLYLFMGLSFVFYILPQLPNWKLKILKKELTIGHNAAVKKALMKAVLTYRTPKK